MAGFDAPRGDAAIENRHCKLTHARVKTPDFVIEFSSFLRHLAFVIHHCPAAVTRAED
jgi:hypothetical protein